VPAAGEVFNGELDRASIAGGYSDPRPSPGQRTAHLEPDSA
jgi:hypothetical protein